MARQTAMRTGPTRTAQSAAAVATRPPLPTGGPSRKAPLQRLSPGVYRDASGRLTNSSGRPMRAEDRRPDYRFDFGGVPGKMGEAVGMPQQPTSPGRLGDIVDDRPLDQRDRIGLPRSTNPDYERLYQEAKERAEAIRSGGMVTYDYNPERDRMVQELLQAQRQPIQAYPQMPFPSPNQNFSTYMNGMYNPGQQYQPMQQPTSIWQGPLQQRTSGEMSPAELKAIQNGTFKGYAY